MDNTWKYKIELENADVFSEIEKERGIQIPEDLKNFILAYNAATPSKYNFMVGSAERVLGAVLSFNRNESDVDSVFDALTVIDDRNLLPFAVDSFGNYICYSLNENVVVFWNHETSNVSSTEKDLQEFQEALY
jgi:hypothetical protein